MSQTPNLQMDYIISGQAQKEVTHNDALNDLDCLTQLAVIDRTLSTPPASPVDGDIYIVGAAPTGAWSGQAGAVAAYYGGWNFKTPKAGWRAFARNESRLYYYSGTGWSLLCLPKLDATFTFNPGTIANGGAVNSSAITITGASFGDFVQVAAPYSLQGAVVVASVTAANQVMVRVQNNTGASVTFSSGTWRVRVEKA